MFVRELLLLYDTAPNTFEVFGETELAYQNCQWFKVAAKEALLEYEE